MQFGPLSEVEGNPLPQYCDERFNGT